MEKVKVIQLIHGFTTGGAENLVKQYCLLFDKDKIELLVLALHNHHSIFDRELAENGIRVVYIDDIIDKRFCALPTAVQKVMHRVYRKSLVKRSIENFSPDVIHYHILLSEYVKYANPSTDTKIYLTIHSAPKKLWTEKRDRQKDRKATEWLIEKKNFRFISLHEEMRREMNEMFGVDDTIVVKNGVMIERFTVNTPKEKLKEELGIPKSAAVIGHIGRFIEVKNHRFLLDVFERYLEINEAAVLLLIGVGALKDDIEKLAKEKKMKDKVYFLGARSDVPKLLHIMDAMVFPSLYEGLPVTLIEAQTAGVPCLVSNRVTEEARISNILFFESLDHSADAWSKRLDEIIQNIPKLIVNTKDWDLKNIVRELEELYIS